MKLTLLSLSILSGSLFLMPGCKKVSSDDLKDTVPYYQSYTVTYDKTDNKTKAGAIFRIRESTGNRVELENGATIKANGIEQNTNQLISAIYSWNFEGIKDISFELKKNSGQIFTNTVVTGDIGDIAFPSNIPVKFSKFSGLTFSWAGPALGTGEVLYVKLFGQKTDGTGEGTVSVTPSAGSVTFTNSDLKDIKPGNVTIEMLRIKKVALDAPDGTAGGEIEMQIQTEKTLAME